MTNCDLSLLQPRLKLMTPTAIMPRNVDFIEHLTHAEPVRWVGWLRKQKQKLPGISVLASVSAQTIHPSSDSRHYFFLALPSRDPHRVRLAQPEPRMCLPCPACPVLSDTHPSAVDVDRFPGSTASATPPETAAPRSGPASPQTVAASRPVVMKTPAGTFTSNASFVVVP